MSRIKDYLKYHQDSLKVRDIDPQNDALKYLCDRYELNIEQRHWLSFLFGLTYCFPSVFYIYNEFPDFENVDVGRLSLWWKSNKKKVKFQKDRLRIKNSDKFVETFLSYRSMIGRRGQAHFFKRLANSPSPIINHQRVWDHVSKNLKNFGRFSNFIYLELLKEICGLRLVPEKLHVKEAKTSREGLCYALGFDHLIGKGSKPINKGIARVLETNFKRLVSGMNATAWAAETTLCAYKKHCENRRWVGYYIDRQFDDIKEMEDAVTEGVDWTPLWQFRRETYYLKHLTEITGRKSSMENPYVC